MIPNKIKGDFIMKMKTIRKQFIESFICPECFKEISINGNISFDLLQEDDNVSFDLTDGLITPYCHECRKLLFKCDYKIRNIIIRLNKAGLKTDFCCEGHFVCDKNSIGLHYAKEENSEAEYDINNAYIAFDDQYEKLKRVMESNTFKYWVLCETCSCKSKRDSYDLSIKTDIIYKEVIDNPDPNKLYLFNQLKKEYLKELFLIVNLLEA